MRRAVGLGIAVALAAAAPAAAHTEVVKRSPRPGKTLDRGPKKVAAKFSQQIRSGASITVSSGRTVVMRGGNDAGDVTRIVARRGTRLGPGTYRVRWSMQALDGHDQSGSWTFSVR